MNAYNIGSAHLKIKFKQHEVYIQQCIYGKCVHDLKFYIFKKKMKKPASDSNE